MLINIKPVINPYRISTYGWARSQLVQAIKKENLKVSPQWWRHQMKTFSALLALCARNSAVTGEFPSQRPVTRSFDVSLIYKRLSIQSWGWWFETPWHSLLRYRNVTGPFWGACSGNQQRKPQSFTSLVLFQGNPSVTDGLPSQRASNAENVSVAWRHRVFLQSQQPSPVQWTLLFRLLTTAREYPALRQRSTTSKCEGCIH